MATSRIPRIGLALLVAALPAIGLLACRGQLSPDGSSASTASVPAPLPAPVAPVTPVTPPAPVEPARPAAPTAVVAQIDQGAALFQRNCAQCHGARGEGTDGRARASSVRRHSP